jgi:hypothetical protein
VSQLLDSALAKLRQAADDNAPVELLGNECRVLLCELDGLRSTVAITTTPDFHDQVERYRKTGRGV